MNLPQNTYIFNGTKVQNTWIRTSVIEQYQPISQVYGIVFNQNEEILICRKSKDHAWNLPGGTPHDGESYQQTLQREVLEEVDVTITNIRPLGIQKAETLDEKHDVVFQMRCVADLNEVLPQTPDPDSGLVWERRFVPINNVAEYIDWGAVGERLFKDVVEVFQTDSKIF